MFGGPRLYRYYNYENAQYLEAPTGGWAPDVHPWELAPNQAQALDNFIIRPGKIRMRGPITQRIDLTDGATKYIAPICTLLGDPHWALMVSKEFGTTQSVDHWNVPLVKPSASTSLAIGQKSHTISPTPKWVDLSANTATTPGADLTAVPGPRSINFNGYIYGITYDAQGNASATATDANNNYTIWKTCLYTMPLHQTVFTQPTLRTNAPQGAFDLKGYQARIWMLGGVDIPGGLTVHEPSTLYFTNPIPSTDVGGTGGSAVADWKDPISGAVNKIIMDNNFDDYGVGLAVIRNALLIFRHGSVWVLRGSTTANYTLQPITTELGCLDARTIVEVDGGVYFLSHRGLMFTNGSTVVNVSGAAAYSLQELIANSWSFIVTFGGGASCAQLSDGSVILTVFEGIRSGGFIESTPVWSGLMAMVGKEPVWSRLTSFSWSNHWSRALGNIPGLGTLAISRRDTRQTYVFDDTSITTLEDYDTSGITILSPLNPNSPSEGSYDYTAPATFSYIPAIWTTKLVDVVTASRRRSGQMKRYFLDYSMAKGAQVDAHTYTLSLYDLSGNQLESSQDTQLALLVDAANLGNGIVRYDPAITRYNVDSGREIDDAYFSVSWVGQTGVNASAEASQSDIYGLGVEWQQTGDLRSKG